MFYGEQKQKRWNEVVPTWPSLETSKFEVTISDGAMHVRKNQVNKWEDSWKINMNNANRE
jgi:hypothetical protein